MRRTLFTAIMLAAPRAALACPVCFGQSDSPLASATNTGIIAMLGVVVAVLGCFAAFIVNLNLRARRFAAGQAGSTDVEHSQLSTSTPQEGTAQC
jgi:hypothetical protein